MIILSIVAGAIMWFANATVEWVYIYGAKANFRDRLLLDVPREELYDRIVNFSVVVLLGIVAGRMLDQRIASEEKLKNLASELERSNRELELFARIASHDLKEPLVSVGGYLGLLERRCQQSLDGTAIAYLRKARKSVGRLERLIEDLLSYSRAGAGGENYQPVDPSAVLDTALSNLASLIEAQGAVVTRDPLPEVIADSTCFLQLMQNLVGNSMKFCRDRLPRIHVSAVRNDGESIFSIEDNGIGIAPEHAEEIFVAFRRLHVGKEFPGTGIGLATCKKIVERHGGRIWMEPNIQGGSTFFFTIPHREALPRRQDPLRREPPAVA